MCVCMDLTILRVASFVVIAFVYMLFDVLNKRNIPNIFAYGALAYGLILTILYFNVMTIVVSLAIAAVIGALGYVVYKIGQIGAGDIFEFATLSLIFPFQTYTFFHTAFAVLNIPTIVAVLINTGIAAMIMVPLYYIPRAKLVLKKPIMDHLEEGTLVKSLAVGMTYIAFVCFLYYIGMNAIGLAVVALLGLGSFSTMLFQKPMTESMIENLTWKEMEPEDMIAFNVMNKSEINRVKSHIKSFDRLVTRKMLDEMKARKFEDKLPVYRKAVPFALPIFVGTLATILVGNVIIFILPLHL